MIELAQEYLETSKRLSSYRTLLKTKLKTARGEEYFSLKRRIQTITDEIYEVDRIASYLCSYRKENQEEASA